LPLEWFSIAVYSARVLAFAVFGPRWLAANSRYNQAITRTHDLNLASFTPLHAWYRSGGVYVSECSEWTREEREAHRARGRELLEKLRAIREARKRAMH
jgi:hypothetical protein